MKFLLILLLCCSHTYASSVIFARDTIIVKGKREVAVPQFVRDTQNAAEQAGEEVPQPEVTHITQEQEYVITLRRADQQGLQWVSDNSVIRGNFGVLYYHDAPQMASVVPQSGNAVYDIVFINGYGEVTALAQNIALAELIEPLQSNAKALLYLAKGTIARDGIIKGDKIIHPMFVKRPDFTD